MPAVIKKRAIISRSGIYRYGSTEIPRLQTQGLGPMPDKHKGLRIFNVYRPASVIQDSAEFLKDLPITIEHSGVRVDGENYQQHGVGWTGSAVEIVPIADGKEIGIETELNLIDNKAKNYYRNGFIEVSPNYDGAWRWQDGVAPDGQEYQIIMDKVTTADSLAMTQKGRGGMLVAIQDSAFEENDMKTGFWRWLRRKFAPVGDSHLEFKAQLAELVKNRSEWTPAMISDAVDKLRKFCEDLPVSDKKEVLVRTISDLWDINNVLNTDEAVTSAANQIVGLYEELDSDASSEMDKLFAEPVGVGDAEPDDSSTPPAPAPDAAPPAPPADVPDPAAPAPAAPAEPAPIDIMSIPLDKTQWSDDMIAAIIMAALKFLQAQAPAAPVGGEPVADPNAPSPPPAAADTGAPAPTAEPPAPEPEAASEKEPTGDSSPFRQSLQPSKVAGKSISEFSKSLTTRRSASK